MASEGASTGAALSVEQLASADVGLAGLHALPDPRGQVARVLRAVGLDDRADEVCGMLSRGLRQRVSPARALLPDGELLFLDEPTSGLDPGPAREVHELVDGQPGTLAVLPVLLVAYLVTFGVIPLTPVAGPPAGPPSPPSPAATGRARPRRRS